MPLNADDDLLGILHLYRSPGQTPFEADSLNTLEGIAHHAALALQVTCQQAVKNWRYGQLVLVRSVSNQIANEIDLGLLCQRVTRLARNLPCEALALWLVEDAPEKATKESASLRRQAQHGVKPERLERTLEGEAVRQRMLQALNAQNGLALEAVLAGVNRLLIVDVPDSMFVTVAMGVLDLRSGRVSYANAGHNRPLLRRALSGAIEMLPKGGMALGVLPENRYTLHHLALQAGDCLLFYTDGVSESFSPLGGGIWRKPPDRYVD